MNYELSEIKHIRKKLGLSQTDLAKRANVSQSLIAKIEAGRIDPTYSKAQKVLDSLRELSGQKEIKAEEIMNNKIISVSEMDNIKEAIHKMKKHEISQMPVVEGNEVTGLISEAIILDALTGNRQDSKIRDIMTDSPPIVSKETQLSVLSNLLKYFPMVVVSEKGKLRGIVTKSDILRKAYKN